MAILWLCQFFVIVPEWELLMLPTRDGVKIPVKKMQIFMFPSNPMAKKIFLLNKLSGQRALNFLPFQHKPYRWQWKKWAMSLDPINHKSSCAVGFTCLDREGTLIRPYFQPSSHSARKTLFQSGIKEVKPVIPFKSLITLSLYKSSPWINGSFTIPLNFFFAAPLLIKSPCW